MKILLVEPNYRTTFPPLGLLRISAYYKSKGIQPIFVRGCDKQIAQEHWNKIYVSTLFTFELPRAVKTIQFYSEAVDNPSEDIIVGGIGVTLLPDYVISNVTCKVITGPLEHPNIFGENEPPIATFTPDYEILKTVQKLYRPENAYFTRVTMGCIRNCGFCAVPVLERKFYYLQPITEQVNNVIKRFGEKRDLIVLDNNILALDNIENVLQEIYDLGFHKGAIFEKKKRVLDFNQGIDVRLITPRIANALGKLAVYPVRLALDHISVEKKYREGVKLLAEQGITDFMTYVMFNFNDTPEDFYRRLEINLELSEQYNIKITGFPMRYCPINDVNRHYISPKWNWKYLRGIQCILSATHGVVSTNPEFFRLSFGRNFEEFRNIVSMPDPYIIYRKKYSEESKLWRDKFLQLTEENKAAVFENIKKYQNRKSPNYFDDLLIS